VRDREPRKSRVVHGPSSRLTEPVCLCSRDLWQSDRKRCSRRTGCAVKVDGNEFLQTLCLTAGMPFKKHVLAWSMRYPEVTQACPSIARIEVPDRCFIDHMLLTIHRPLGILILILTAIRFINRICTKLPPFPPTMSRQVKKSQSVLIGTRLEPDPP
jgi:hypothetical protein